MADGLVVLIIQVEILGACIAGVLLFYIARNCTGILRRHQELNAYYNYDV